jgi:hypothetical protein
MPKSALIFTRSHAPLAAAYADAAANARQDLQRIRTRADSRFSWLRGYVRINNPAQYRDNVDHGVENTTLQLSRRHWLGACKGKFRGDRDGYAAFRDVVLDRVAAAYEECCEKGDYARLVADFKAHVSKHDGRVGLGTFKRLLDDLQTSAAKRSREEEFSADLERQTSPPRPIPDDAQDEIAALLSKATGDVSAVIDSQSVKLLSVPTALDSPAAWSAARAAQAPGRTLAAPGRDALIRLGDLGVFRVPTHDWDTFQKYATASRSRPELVGYVLPAAPAPPER